MNTFAEFINISIPTLCKEYFDKLNNAKSKKALIDLALDANGLSWTAEAVVKEELPIEVIANDFKPFLNGKYVREADGFTSALFCDFDGEIRVTTTCALIIGYKGIVRVDRPIAELYLANSDVTILANEGSKVNVYLYNSTVVNNDFVVIKEKKEY